MTSDIPEQLPSFWGGFLCKKENANSQSRTAQNNMEKTKSCHQ